MSINYTETILKQIFLSQVLLVILSSIFCFLLGFELISFLGGALICLLSNLLSYGIFTRNKYTSLINIVLSNFYLAGIVKFIFTILLFSFMLTLTMIKPASLLLGYILAQLCYWLAVYLVFNIES